MKEKIDPTKIPEHIAIIMDGNGRWAKKRGAARLFGHRNAIKAVRDVTEGCAELEVGRLTLPALSYLICPTAAVEIQRRNKSILDFIFFLTCLIFSIYYLATCSLVLPYLLSLF